MTGGRIELGNNVRHADDHPAPALVNRVENAVIGLRIIPGVGENEQLIAGLDDKRRVEFAPLRADGLDTFEQTAVVTAHEQAVLGVRREQRLRKILGHALDAGSHVAQDRAGHVDEDAARRRGLCVRGDALRNRRRGGGRFRRCEKTTNKADQSLLGAQQGAHDDPARRVDYFIALLLELKDLVIEMTKLMLQQPLLFRKPGGVVAVDGRGVFTRLQTGLLYGRGRQGAISPTYSLSANS